MIEGEPSVQLLPDEHLPRQIGLITVIPDEANNTQCSTLEVRTNDQTLGLVSYERTSTTRLDCYVSFVPNDQGNYAFGPVVGNLVSFAQLAGVLDRDVTHLRLFYPFNPDIPEKMSNYFRKGFGLRIDGSPDAIEAASQVSDHTPHQAYYLPIGQRFSKR